MTDLASESGKKPDINQPSISHPQPTRNFENEGPVPHKPTVIQVEGLTFRPRQNDARRAEFSNAKLPSNIVIERHNIAPASKPKTLNEFRGWKDRFQQFLGLNDLIPSNPLSDAQHIDLPPNEGPKEPSIMDQPERFSIPLLEKHNEEKAENEKQALLTEQFLNPDGKIVIEKLRNFLTSLSTEELSKRMIETGTGELVAFKNVGVHSGQKIDFAEAVKLLQQEKFDLYFVIKQHGHPTRGEVNDLIASTGREAKNFVPKYIIVNLSDRDFNQEKPSVPTIGYIQENSVQSIRQAFEEDTDFVPVNDEYGSLYDTQSFYSGHQESARQVMFRSILIALNDELPDWFTKNIEVKMRFIEDATELLRFIRQADEKNEIFDFGQENFLERYEEMMKRFELYRKDLSNPVAVRKVNSMDQSSTYPGLEINYKGQITELFTESVQTELQQLNMDQRSITLQSGYVVQLQLAESFSPITTEERQAIKRGLKPPNFYLKGLLLTHPAHPQMQITIDFDNLSRKHDMTEAEIRENLSQPMYLVRERISKIDIRGTEQFSPQPLREYKPPVRPEEAE